MQRWLNGKEITQSNIGTNFRIRYRMCMRQKQPDKRSIPVTVLQVPGTDRQKTFSVQAKILL